MNDITESILTAEVQHGQSSRRMYLMNIREADPAALAVELINRSREAGYTKIFAKLPDTAAGPFLAAGYIQEAAMPRGSSAEAATLFLAYYLDESRSIPRDAQRLQEVLDLCRSRKPAQPKKLVHTVSCEVCRSEDTPEMAEVYRRVFPSYPFPIQDAAYLRETMESHVLYCGIRIGGKLAALASAELYPEYSQAEMTDFATLPEHRGYGFASILLSFMEKRLPGHGIAIPYTIARAVSPGMNITFASAGYSYSGQLINNTQISGSIETMNVWYKVLGS